MKEKQEDGGGKEKGVKTGSGRGNTVLEAWSRKVKGLQLEGNHRGPSRKQGPIQKGVTRTHVWTRWGSRVGGVGRLRLMHVTLLTHVSIAQLVRSYCIDQGTLLNVLAVCV